MQKQNELNNKDIALRSAESDLSGISTQSKENDRNYHLLLKDHEREQKLYAEKAHYIQDMCEKLVINVDFDINNCNDRSSDLIVSIQSALAKLNDEIQEIITTNNKIDDDQQKDIQMHRSYEARIKTGIESIVEQLNKLESELDKNRNELKSIELGIDDKLKNICIRIAKNKSDLEQLTATTNVEGVRNEIAMNCDEEQKLCDKLNEIDVQIRSITNIATLLTEIKTKENHIKKRAAEIRDIREKHYESFKTLFPDENIETFFKQRIDTLSKELRTQTNLFHQKIQWIQNKIQNKENQLQHKKQERDNFEEEIKSLEEEINRECGETAYEEVLSSTKECVEKYQMEFSALQSSGVFYKK